MFYLNNIKVRQIYYKIKNYYLFHAVPGFERIIGRFKRTCYRNQIAITTNTDVVTCRNSCEKDATCNYFFFDEDKKCRTFRTCVERQSMRHFGQTYQKAKGIS